MKQHLLVVMALAAMMTGFVSESWAQYPGMKQEAWYKENVLKSDNPGAEVVEEETEGVLQQMQRLQASKSWHEMLDLYPQAKKEYSRNRNVYGYARFALRNLLGESSNQNYLDQLDQIYNDYYAAGLNPDTYNYAGRDNGNQWNEMQQMLDYARFSSCVDFETRSAKIMAFVQAQGEKADPWIIYNGIMLPINEQMKVNIESIRKDNKKSQDYYSRLTAIQTEFEREDAFLKENSNNYSAYVMDRKIEVCESSRMLVIPFAEYIKIHPESEIEAHKNDEAYLAKRSEEMSSRWPKEALTRKVDTYYANIGATYAKFRTLGNRALDQKDFDTALRNYERAYELAENDNQHAEAYYYQALTYHLQKRYSLGNTTINKAIELIDNDMRFYNLKSTIILAVASTVKSAGIDLALDINVLVTNAIMTVNQGKRQCSKDDQASEFEKAETNIQNAKKLGHKYVLAKGQLFMKGLSVGQNYMMQSGDIRLSAPLTEY
ncbi:MAG: tetratricopeptide repeat protein [Bacteroidales bacterium]|nr:tetratricopeptide repeat protein [Candidatus Liminaster caballi]